jgi:hypothetical protein
MAASYTINSTNWVMKQVADSPLVARGVSVCAATLTSDGSVTFVVPGMKTILFAIIFNNTGGTVHAWTAADLGTATASITATVTNAHVTHAFIVFSWA